MDGRETEDSSDLSDARAPSRGSLWAIAAIAVIGAIIAVALLLPMLSDRKAQVVDRRVETLPVDRTTQAKPTAAGILTDLSALVAANHASPLIHERIRVEGAPVQNVERDHIFWIGLNSDQKLLVVLQEGLWTPTHGDRVVLTGIVRVFPDIVRAKKHWDLDEENIGPLTNTRTYLFADGITQVEDELSEGPLNP